MSAQVRRRLRRGPGWHCVRAMTQEAKPALYFEDLAVGAAFGTPSVEVTAEEVRTFAARYDPQPFHLDEAAGRASVFGAMVASGWMTAALTMRLMVQSEMRLADGAVGLGIDALDWPRPVRPGDTLTARMEIEAVRVSESRPEFGVVKLRTTTRNQHGRRVQVLVSNILVRRRPADGATNDTAGAAQAAGGARSDTRPTGGGR